MDIEINYKPKIFDDPEFCEDKEKQCFYLDERSDPAKEYCNQFPGGFEGKHRLDSTKNKNIKHDECKKHYKEANK